MYEWGDILGGNVLHARIPIAQLPIRRHAASWPIAAVRRVDNY